MKGLIMKFEKEIEYLKSSFEVLTFRGGVAQAIMCWLSLVGNISILYQCIVLSWNVIFNSAGVADILIWYPILFAVIFLTPKILGLSNQAEELFAKAYTALVNGAFSLLFILLIYNLMSNNGYVLSLNLNAEGFFNKYVPGKDFAYISSIGFIYIWFYLFSLYLNRSLPLGYLNYASFPMFVVIMVSIVYAVYLGDKVSIYKYFEVSNIDGAIRLGASVISIAVYLNIVQKTAFSTLREKKKAEKRELENKAA